ncbi:Kinesin-like protein FLA10 [Acorus gramineus]|uniref:Kinesin-like protein n=1 Tax=Acorus gramineus TaxID=55184 RepID=A0AAV9AVU5_ACOGR|nr:Kinesin-like protein FLA10 [Acorus gramineus]
MPVSTRSKVHGGQDDPKMDQRLKLRSHRDEPQTGPPAMTAPLHWNPHHGLKEKMRELTLFYEQQQQQQHRRRFSTSHPSVDLFGGGAPQKLEEDGPPPEAVMKERNQSPAPPKGKPAFPVVVEAKENRIAVYSCSKKASTAVKKLEMVDPVGTRSVLRASRGERIVQGGELEAVSENPSTNGSRILVFVRLRPTAKKEKEAGSRCCVKIMNKRDVYLTEFGSENDYLRLKRLRGRHFTFDASLPDTTTQQEVYNTTTSELLEAVLQGRNGSVFCYGATGAGKTYTMLGTIDNPGVMVLAIKDLFSKIRQRSCDGDHTVHLSYLEVYNETVRDLLSPGRPLVLREDKQGIVASGLTQYRAYSTDEVMALLQQGNQNRTTEPTRANETSSRSHAILQVIAEYHVREGTNIVTRVGKLSLIDLAGSERSLATDQRTLRSIEGANINRSLLALSSCINALVEGKKHIPYRNSKLTQLLKDSLGGACNTVMIANISPSHLQFGETQNTLHWADRAKEIRTKACVTNEETMQVPETETDQAKLVLELQKENAELRAQLARQQQKLLTVQAQSLAANSTSTPTSASTLLRSPMPSAQQKRRTRSTILKGNCFNTPDHKKDETVRELQRAVKSLEAEMERLKKEHQLQMRQKDDFIREISRNNAKLREEEDVKRVVTRASLRPKEALERTRGAPKGEKAMAAGELKSPKHRFLSPTPTAKKRSFWDITTVNSPSVVTVNGRKTRSHVALDHTTAPSMLLQVK